MDVNKLKARMVLVGVNGERLADELGISEATFYRRMKQGGNNFSRAEINQMIASLHLTPQDTMDIFFADEVS